MKPKLKTIDKIVLILALVTSIAASQSSSHRLRKLSPEQQKENQVPSSSSEDHQDQLQTRKKRQKSILKAQTKFSKIRESFKKCHKLNTLRVTKYQESDLKTLNKRLISTPVFKFFVSKKLKNSGFSFFFDFFCYIFLVLCLFGFTLILPCNIWNKAWHRVFRSRETERQRRLRRTYTEQPGSKEIELVDVIKNVGINVQVFKKLNKLAGMAYMNKKVEYDEDDSVRDKQYMIRLKKSFSRIWILKHIYPLKISSYVFLYASFVLALTQFFRFRFGQVPECGIAFSIEKLFDEYIDAAGEGFSTIRSGSDGGGGVYGGKNWYFREFGFRDRSPVLDSLGENLERLKQDGRSLEMYSRFGVDKVAQSLEREFIGFHRDFAFRKVGKCPANVNELNSMRDGGGEEFVGTEHIFNLNDSEFINKDIKKGLEVRKSIKRALSS